MDGYGWWFNQEEWGTELLERWINPQILHSDTTCDKKLEQEWWFNPQKTCDFSRKKMSHGIPHGILDDPLLGALQPDVWAKNWIVSGYTCLYMFKFHKKVTSPISLTGDNPLI